MFELAAGTWDETVLSNFGHKEEERPWGGVILDSHGNLYGTTAGDRERREGGTVYQLTSGGKEIILYTFQEGKYEAIIYLRHQAIRCKMGVTGQRARVRPTIVEVVRSVMEVYYEPSHRIPTTGHQWRTHNNG